MSDLRDGAIAALRLAWREQGAFINHARTLDALLDYLEQEMTSRMPGLWYVSDMIAKLRENTALDFYEVGRPLTDHVAGPIMHPSLRPDEREDTE